MKATCTACGREFECSELMVKLVQAGKAESLCGYCDGSHNNAEA